VEELSRISEIPGTMKFRNQEQWARKSAPNTASTRRLGERQGCRPEKHRFVMVGLPLSRRAHALRAVRHSVWLEADSDRIVLSRPSHQYPYGA
jgi:hypothetical protein